MGIWDRIVGDVAKNVFQFNDFMLLEYRKREVNKSKEFMNIVYKEAVEVKPYAHMIKQLGYRVLNPAERILFKINNTLIRGQYNIQQTELELVEFLFQFEDEVYPVYLYLPYLHNNAIIIGDTHYHIQLAIIERIIYRITNGCIIKVMRSPLHAWRNESISITSLNGQIYHEAVLTIKAHSKKSSRPRKKDIKTTILLYLLVIYGLHGVKKLFGLEEQELFFSNTNELQHSLEYEVFKCKEHVYLNVNRSKMTNTNIRRIVASILYMLQFFVTTKAEDGFSVNDLVDPEARYWKVILGKSIYGMSVKNSLAINHADIHLDSLSTYLDPLTKKSLSKLNIECTDIYEMFYQIFINLDDWLVNHQPNNLFDKKLGVLESLLSDIIKNTFIRFYDFGKQQKVISPKVVKRLLKMHCNKINGIYSNNIIRSNPSQYGDNWLLTIGMKKVRERANQDRGGSQGANLLGSKEHQLHASMALVESITTIPSSSPGVGGSINPFCLIDEEDGTILRPPYAAEVEKISAYLPNK